MNEKTVSFPKKKKNSLNIRNLLIINKYKRIYKKISIFFKFFEFFLKIDKFLL